ncbi:MAG: hypothetical protein ACREHG_03500 [Candidatus Saccharimonadales bacterium]
MARHKIYDGSYFKLPFLLWKYKMDYRFSEILKAHSCLAVRHETSRNKVDALRGSFEQDVKLNTQTTTIYCAGSVAREEIGNKSDLDLFFVSEDQIECSDTNLAKELYAQASIHGEVHKFPRIVIGRYSLVYSAHEMQEKTGTPLDDAENLFTARMLLLLESNYITNKELYFKQINNVLNNYFRDSKGKHYFRPLFLLNDILRYWRTLCLNYEQIRTGNKPWGKKNINLKFARMITVYGTVLPLISKPMSDALDMASLCRMRPLERFAYGLDLLNAPELTDRFREFLDIYEDFLSWKELDEVDGFVQDRVMKDDIRKAADKFSLFIYDAVMHNNVGKEYKRFLVI